jgi:hypothetical protein
MQITESRGPSLKQARGKKDVEYLSIFGLGTAKAPGWRVCEYSSKNDTSPTEHEFSDGHEMLAYVAEAAGVPNENEQETAEEND